MSKIDIGIKIDLEKLISSRLLIQASSGGGKSWAIRKTAEELIGHVQVIIIDIEGEFVSLREKFPFALVSKEGEIPLNLRYAETLAHKLLETNLSAVIDLSEMEVYQRRMFAKRFSHALIESPKHLWHPCVVIIDEADFFAPQGKDSESTNAIINLSSRGRKRGICPIYATQRIAKLHKDATADVLNKIIGLTGQDIDQQRAGSELGFTNKQDVIGLRKLSPGEFYGFGPAISNEVTKFKVGKVKTTHMEAGQYKKVLPATPNAIKKILGKLADIPEEAEKELNTKKEYEAEIKRLKTELRSSKVVVSSDNPKVHDEKLKQEVASLKSQLQAEKNNYAAMVKLVRARDSKVIGAAKLLQEISGLEIPERKEAPEPVIKPIAFTNGVARVDKKSTTSAFLQHNPKNADHDGKSLPPGEKAILTACAQFGHAMERNQLTVLTGYKRSSRDAYIARLKEKGYIETAGSGVAATESGYAVLGENFQCLPTGYDLQTYWLNKLPPGEKVILELLIKAHPNPVPRDTISEKTSYMRSSRDAYLARMASKELIEIVGRGEVKASLNLFD